MVPEGLLTLSSPSLLGTLGTLVTQKPLGGAMSDTCPPVLEATLPALQVGVFLKWGHSPFRLVDSCEGLRTELGACPHSHQCGGGWGF